MDNKQLYCNKCDDLVSSVMKETEIKHTIRGEDIVLNVDMPYCATCGSRLSDIEIEKRHFNEALEHYRSNKNIVSPEKIKKIRESYKLSQRAFARVLGFSEPTINRYELGALPDNTHSNLIQLAEEPENMLKLAKSNKYLLSEKEFQTICKNANEMLKVQEALFPSQKYSELVNQLNLMSKEVDRIKRVMAQLHEIESHNIQDRNHKNPFLINEYEDYNNAFALWGVKSRD